MQNASVPDAPARPGAYTPPPPTMTAPPAPPEPRDLVARILPAAAVVVLLLSLLPVATLVPGGSESGTWRLQVEEWASGTAIVAGLAFVAAILWRRLGRTSTTAGAPAWSRHAPLLATLLAAASFALSASVADGVAGRQSIQIDEVAQTMQARTFADGRLAADTPAPLEFFATQHMLYTPNGTFSQFPPGGPAAIALGIVAGAEWLVGPAFALLALLAWGAWLRATGEPRGTALLAFALLALSPFAFFMGGTRMNHVPTAALVLGASAALAAVARPRAGDRPRGPRSRALLALACGLGYGLAATVRPLDAAAFAIPGAVWLLTLAVRDLRRPAAEREGRLADLLLSGVGVAAPLAFLLWFNARTTGEPLLFGYQLLWGKAHDLGFHPAPFGAPHTPARGLEMVALYLFQLQRNFLETPVPSLLAALGAWMLVRRTTAADRYLLAGGLLTLLAYWAYWHEGYFLGPRFLYPLVPVFALWTARFPALARARLERDGRPSPAWPPLAAAMLVAVAIAALYTAPMRWMQYRETFGVFRWNAADAARTAGVRNALVLVRDGWESQLVVRQWALGIPHAGPELYYRTIDACRLDQALSMLERTGASSATAERHLRALTADSLRVQLVRLESGANVRVQPGVRYSATCLQRVGEIERGIVALAPILAQPADGNVYARDLHARDTLLLARYPGRPVWLLAAENPRPNARPRFFRVDPDSLRHSWATEAAEAASAAQ